MEEPEVSKELLFPHDEVGPTDTSTLFPDELNIDVLTAIFSSDSDEPNLPWDEAM